MTCITLIRRVCCLGGVKIKAILLEDSMPALLWFIGTTVMLLLPYFHIWW